MISYIRCHMQADLIDGGPTAMKRQGLPCLKEGAASGAPTFGTSQDYLVHRFSITVPYLGLWWDRRLACRLGQAGCLSHQRKRAFQGLPVAACVPAGQRPARRPVATGCRSGDVVTRPGSQCATAFEKTSTWTKPLCGGCDCFPSLIFIHSFPDKKPRVRLKAVPVD